MGLKNAMSDFSLVEEGVEFFIFTTPIHLDIYNLFVQQMLNMFLIFETHHSCFLEDKPMLMCSI